MKPIKPAIRIESNRNFYYPPALISDYDRLLETDLPNFTYTLKRIKDWSKQIAEDELPQLRGAIFPINWKSKISGSDSALNLRVSLKEEIFKGDYLLREDGELFMVTWDINKEINNQKTQIQKPNAKFTIARTAEPQVDSRTGKYIMPTDSGVIVKDTPVICHTNQMRFDYEIALNTPAIVPQHALLCSMQYNPETKNIKIGDSFHWGNTNYRIVDLTWSEVDTVGNFGIISFSANKIAGEEDDL